MIVNLFTNIIPYQRKKIESFLLVSWPFSLFQVYLLNSRVLAGWGFSPTAWSCLVVPAIHTFISTLPGQSLSSMVPVILIILLPFDVHQTFHLLNFSLRLSEITELS